MLVNEAMRLISIKYNKYKDFDSSGDDYDVILALVNDKINLWENEEGILWRELFTSDVVTLDANGQAPLPNFILPANHLFIGANFYEYISPELLQEHLRQTPSKRVYTVVGGDTEKKLDVYPTPSAGSIGTINYYKKARTYTTGTETEPIEMADPYFIIHAASAELFLDDSDTEKAGIAFQIAEQKLESMKTKNHVVPVFANNKQPDYDFQGFGN